ncbi:BZ3500_MvSof-1268-A1-R1_Chr1-3g01742 [Microbotryum saponariae]|uniref:BZ3500_MvSof-1268-A1-R1_Chr1-3g01742 protein n=1 Tax=Microbotryum saponariae TaxID=289078 RepID=A0A2X0MRF6_9BASI|nr:BZ3500_MvSof-1268-A1-R1_Chr1-3g01742 [Microbotryum saponariae]SCZ94495.1 BZ3501_MvSof-1269-A2-R1_Chr1-3g01344 [Microbotryum saponariae]
MVGGHQPLTSSGTSICTVLQFEQQYTRITDAILARSRELTKLPPNSTPELIEEALQALPKHIPEKGWGLKATTDLLLDKICPALAVGQAGPRYYGLITGGVTSAAHLADNLVTSFDPNVQVHQPEETISTILEQITLSQLLDFLSLPRDRFTHNTFTTGATASNILGLALGRDYVVSCIKGSSWSVAEDGYGDVPVKVFVAGAHASVAKAASLVGIGRRNVYISLMKGWTGEVHKIRHLCDQGGAWLHVDSAFAVFASVLPEFKHWVDDVALADSICSDAHKWLNVPYDCGIFFSRSSGLYELLGPGQNSPAYLRSTRVSVSSSPTETTTPLLDPYRTMTSPLFLNVENSRRFRALPVYTSLISLGKLGYADLFASNIAFARRIASYLDSHPAFEVLTPSSQSPESKLRFRQLNIVLFAPSMSKGPVRFRGENGADVLRQEINNTGRMYCTGTKWKGRGAIRIAVSNWLTSEKRDWPIVKEVFDRVTEEVTE